MAIRKRPELAKHPLIDELPRACADEAAAVEFLESKRWGDCPCCPHCGSVAVYKMTARDGTRNNRFMWRCKDCMKQYTVRANSVLSESLIPLHKWCRAMWMTATAKNGVSALELQRTLQVNYRTALFVLHRLRYAMAHDPDTDPKLTGTIEADETYVGGKPRYHPRPKKPEGPLTVGHFSKIPLPLERTKKVNADRQGRSLKHKVPVFAAVQRGGEVRTRVIPNVTAANLGNALLDHSEPTQTVLMTDDYPSYRRIGKPFVAHEVIRHSVKEYVRGEVHTNTIEGFFSRVKRQLNGTYHAVSKEHLHRYMDHAAFLYNTRQLTDGERTLALLGRIDGKRLMYKDPVKRKTA